MQVAKWKTAKLQIAKMQTFENCKLQNMQKLQVAKLQNSKNCKIANCNSKLQIAKWGKGNIVQDLTRMGQGPANSGGGLETVAPGGTS